MSRIGKNPIPVPSGVTVTVDGLVVRAKGSKGELSFAVSDDVELSKSDDGALVVKPHNQSKESLQKWGMTRTVLSNLLRGVQGGFDKRLEIHGVGYRAAMKGKNLKLSLGFSHEVSYLAPEGITIAVPKPTEIVISGIDKQMVGQVAAEIQKFRPPEPYKGKGLRYAGSVIVRKESKKG